MPDVFCISESVRANERYLNWKIDVCMFWITSWYKNVKYLPKGNWGYRKRMHWGEEREQLVLRADTGHVGKGSAAAYDAVKRPFSLSLSASLHQLSLPGLATATEPANQPWPASRTQAFLRSASSLCWNPGAAVSTNSAHTHILVRCSCICVLTLRTELFMICWRPVLCPLVPVMRF